jgi:hypothetical protein
MGMDFQQFKDAISIVQVAETLGYQYNRRKGRNPMQFEHPNGDKVIISEKGNASDQLYFTRNSYEDRGSVINFVKNRLAMFNVHYTTEWEGVNKVLSGYVQIPYNPKQTAKYQLKPKAIKAPFNPEAFHISDPSLSDLSYLQYERKIHPSTLQTFLPFMKIAQEKGGKYKNIGFVYTVPGSDKITGFELVNFHFKGHAKGSERSTSVWLVELATDKSVATDLYFGESAIDVMSFYQLYQNKFNFNNAVFVSTGGNLLKGQAQNVLNEYPRAKVHTLFDNDFSGCMYDISLACLKKNVNISIRKNAESVQFTLPKGTYELPTGQVSLSRFERISGIRSGVRAHKSKGKDFNEMLKSRNGTELKVTMNKTRKR